MARRKKYILSRDDSAKNRLSSYEPQASGLIPVTRRTLLVSTGALAASYSVGFAQTEPLRWRVERDGDEQIDGREQLRITCSPDTPSETNSPDNPTKTKPFHGRLMREVAFGEYVRFYTAAALVHELLEARDEKRLLRLQRQVAGYKLLIIDELGYVPLSQTGAELLFEMVSQRYERGSTIVTSNLPFDEWTSVFGSERLTGALLDRLAHHVHILEMNGDSYRLNQSKRRSRHNNADTPKDDPTPT